MLAYLRISNIAIIEELQVDFTGGLNVISGETGAGKSVIVRALNFLSGTDAGRNLAGPFEKEVEVEALFNISGEQTAVLQDGGFDIENEIAISRRISDEGKSRCFINGRVAPVSTVREITKNIVEIQSQHAGVSLMVPVVQLKLLDEFCGDSIKEKIRALAAVYRKSREIKQRIDEEKDNLQKILQNKDMLLFQKEEIESANLIPGEEEKLVRELGYLRNQEKIAAGLSKLNEILGGGDYDGIIDNLSSANSILNELSGFDDDFKEMSRLVENSRYDFEDMKQRLSGRSNGFEMANVDETEARLAGLENLKRKYGKSIEEILEFKGQIDKQLSALDGPDLNLEDLNKEASKIEQELNQLNKGIRSTRKDGAKRLSALITGEIRALNMPDGVFEVMLIDREIGPNGDQAAEFLVKTNKGGKLMPLSNIASGGELSRVMLAIKSVFGKIYSMPVLVFDEVESGIGGKTALHVGRRLDKLSVDHQVICITHSPQVACFADSHLVIHKDTSDKKTKARIKAVKGSGQLEELARMMSGKVTSLAMKHAEELIDAVKD